MFHGTECRDGGNPLAGDCGILVAAMPLERVSVERDPINLSVVALENAVNMFLKNDGLSTLVDGVPEHLLVLIASFADTVPADDPRFRSTLELLTSSTHHADQRASLYGKRFASEDERKAYDENLQSLYDALEDPWEVQGFVAKLRAAQAADRFEARAWTNASRFNAFDQLTPVPSGKTVPPSLEALHQMVMLEEGAVIPAEPVGLVASKPDDRTAPPPRMRKPALEAVLGDVEGGDDGDWDDSHGRSIVRGKRLDWRPGKGRSKGARGSWNR